MKALNQALSGKQTDLMRTATEVKVWNTDDKIKGLSVMAISGLITKLIEWKGASSFSKSGQRGGSHESFNQ